MTSRNIKVLFAVVSLAAAGAWSRAAFAQAAAQPGECKTGFCGTPEYDGGGCGCGCGCSILVNYTDIGETYSSSDLDPDHDGVPTAVESNGATTLVDNCATVFNPDQRDADGDKVGDVCDNCPDVANPDQFTLGAHKNDRGYPIGFACDADGDGDGVPSATDNCPMVKNADQYKLVTSHTMGAACDEDIDGDGVKNIPGAQPYDNCPYFANADQALPTDAAEKAKCNTDLDKDGVLDTSDNCVGVPNADQKKSVPSTAYLGNPAYKELGDACNPDIDGDAWTNDRDNCKTVINEDQKDSDNDGVGDVCQTTAFCMHPVQTDSHCLDPQGTFDVYAFPSATVETGNRVYLNVFANRQNVGIKYAWVVEEKPAESNIGVKNARGSVSASENYQYRYASDATRPIFVPDAPGIYKVRLIADLVDSDPLFANKTHAEAVATLTVTGEPQKSAGGCSMSTTRAPQVLWLSLIGLAGLAWGGLSLRSRRARSRR